MNNQFISPIRRRVAWAEILKAKGSTSTGMKY